MSDMPSPNYLLSDAELAAEAALKGMGYSDRASKRGAYNGHGDVHQAIDYLISHPESESLSNLPKAGDFVDLRDEVGFWLEGKIIEQTANRLKVHYIQFGSKYDEVWDMSSTITQERLAEFRQYSSRLAEDVGVIVVGETVSVWPLYVDRKDPSRQWIETTVTEVKDCHIQVSYPNPLKADSKKMSFWYHVRGSDVKTRHGPSSAFTAKPRREAKAKAPRGQKVAENLPRSYEVGDIVDLRDEVGFWLEGEILEKKQVSQIKVRYTQWGSRYDEWWDMKSAVCQERIAEFRKYSMTRAEDAGVLKQGDQVRVWPLYQRKTPDNPNDPNDPNNPNNLSNWQCTEIVEVKNSVHVQVAHTHNKHWYHVRGSDIKKIFPTPTPSPSVRSVSPGPISALSSGVKSPASRATMGVKHGNLEVFSYRDVQRATNDFDENSQIGGGGFGSVHRGSLRIGGKTRQVAIKKLAANSQQGVSHFINEIQLLSQLKGHQNIVSVLGYASTGEQHCVVTPHLARGSLTQTLETDRKHQLEFTALDRMAACYDVANGIAYLHAQKPPVWHLDLNPNNILRGDDESGGYWQLIDFGLSRRMDDMKSSQTHIKTTTLIGTYGYIAKEYEHTGMISASCDVYSLGVIILRVTTGLPVYHDGEFIRERVERTLDDLKANRRNDPLAALLGSELARSSCDWTFEGGATLLQHLLGLGFRCSHPSKLSRPRVATVLEELNQIVNELDQKTKECLLCLDAKRTTVLEPCRHSVACEACAELYCKKSTPCPICRVPIQSISRSTQPVLHTFIRRLDLSDVKTQKEKVDVPRTLPPEARSHRRGRNRGRARGQRKKLNYPRECYNWRDSGSCTYGDTCRYSHA